MKLKLIYLLISGMALISSSPSIENSEVSDGFQLLTTQTKFTAGDTIILKFSSQDKSLPILYISNSYGTTTVKPNIEKDLLQYIIPDALCNKTGVVSWTLINKNYPISGTLHINPKQAVNRLETYLGPPSIEAGGTDYSMLVVIPTDTFDNPLKDSTQVSIKYQFLAHENLNLVYTKNLISYKNIYSEIQTGRILVSSECLNINSKEYDINVLPAIPTNFTITHQRNHVYADGNQITNFSTSIIKDKHNNVVSDGTYVEFIITNRSNNILKTSGTTINGIATAKIIHPDHKDQWQVKAYIEGMAESKTITLTYKQAILDFQVVFSENRRSITVGPLKSFMNQMIPDGLEVTLSAYENGAKTNTLFKSSFEGYTTFKLNTDRFPGNTYTINIEAAGIIKAYKNIKL